MKCSPTGYIIRFTVSTQRLLAPLATSKCNTYIELAQLHSEPDIHMKNITGDFPINFDKETTIFHKSMDCPQKGTIPAFSGSTEVNFDGKSVGNVSYGVVVAGNISPHDMRNFTMFVSLNATITGTLSLNSTLTVRRPVPAIFVTMISSEISSSGYDQFPQDRSCPEGWILPA